MSIILTIALAKFALSHIAVKLATLASDDCSVLFIRDGKVVKWKVREMRRKDRFIRKGPYGLIRVVITYKTIKKMLGLVD